MTIIAYDRMKLLILLPILALLPCHKCSTLRDLDFFDLYKLKRDPDCSRNLSGLISSKGYPVEEYTVTTEDGYLLGVQRIPHGKMNKLYNKSDKRPVVLLQHGLLSSAADFVLNFPKQSLGFILADAGYDVWLGNIRGNTYSRRHVRLNPKMKEFWEFSFDEMGKYDLPAMINFALNKTGQQQLFYIGHSQGTTSMFALLSENPEYNKKVKLFVALAPVSSVGHITSAIRYLAPFTGDLNFLFEILGVNEFLPNSAVMKYFTEHVCDSELKFLCENLIFLICGTDPAQLNVTRLGVYTTFEPAGTSTQSVIHYAQMVNSKKFFKYDYGKSGNMQHYNQATPPEYFVENITAPVALVWSKNDKLADVTDLNILHEKLRTLVASYCVKLDTFNHLDFVWGIEAYKYVYEYVLTLLSKYSSQTF